LAIHAHPDDETITMGGTLARYSAEGARTIVVTCTTGDLGAIGGQERARPPHEVAMLRACELEAAVRTLGVSRLVQLGYADSGMPGTPENDRPGAFWTTATAEVAQRLVHVIQEERPQVMVAYDETGGYGHPDHLKAHQVAVAAYAACPPVLRPRRLYYVRLPRAWAAEFVSALRNAGIDAPASAASGADAGSDVTEIGVPDDLVTTAVDVRRFVPTKLAALACHATQMPPEHFLRRMPLELAERLWAYEFYSRDGAAAENDLFVGLR
jgi:LmbE family N-acetylglucosaminyl deacetylase